MKTQPATQNMKSYILNLDGDTTTHGTLHGAQLALQAKYPGTEGYGSRGHMTPDGARILMAPVDSALPLRISRIEKNGSSKQIGSISFGDTSATA
jgi:hypothetical protein